MAGDDQPHSSALQIQGLQSEVADILKAGQEQNARIKVEEVIRQEMILEAYALLETYLILLQTRAGMLKKAKDPPPDMIEVRHRSQRMCNTFGTVQIKLRLHN